MKRNPQQQELHEALVAYQQRGTQADRERLVRLAAKLVSVVVAPVKIDGLERDDLVSIATLGLLEAAPKYREHKYPYAFLCAAMRNALLSEFQKTQTKSRSAYTTVSLEHWVNGHLNSAEGLFNKTSKDDKGTVFASNVICLDQIAFGRMVHEYIHSNCDALQKQIMDLISEGYSQGEVADELGMERWQIGNEVRKVRMKILRRFGNAYE